MQLQHYTVRRVERHEKVREKGHKKLVANDDSSHAALCSGRMQLAVNEKALERRVAEAMNHVLASAHAIFIKRKSRIDEVAVVLHMWKECYTVRHHDSSRAAKKENGQHGA